MIVITKNGTPVTEVDRICDQLSSWGLYPEKIAGKNKVVVELIGETANVEPNRIAELSNWIEGVLRIDL